MGLQSIGQIGKQMCWPWNPLFFCLIAFELHLQTEWVIGSAVIIQVVIWCTVAHVHSACLQLMCLGSPWFGVCMFLLAAHACEMPKFMASLALILLGRTLESLQVDCVATFVASVPVIVCTPGIKRLLLLCLWFVTVTALVLVVSLFGLPKWSFLLVFTQLATLGAGASVSWFAQLVGPLLPVLYGIQWPWNILVHAEVPRLSYFFLSLLPFW